MTINLIEYIELLENKDSDITHEKVFANVFKILKKYPDAKVEKLGNATRGFLFRKGAFGLALKIKIEKLPTYSRVRKGGMDHPLKSELFNALRKYRDKGRRMKFNNETDANSRFHEFLIHLST